MQDLKITLIQSDLAWEDINANLENFERKISELSDLQDLIILPEMFNTGFSQNPKKIAEKEDGKTMLWLKEQANKNNCVILGSLPFDDNGRYINRVVWMQPDGSYQTSDKRHLFRMAGEHLVYSDGKSKIITEIKGWKVLPLVCYDLRFPVWSKNTYKDEAFEYDLLIYIANWPEVRSYPWKVLLKARAIENISYVAGVNRVGQDGNKMDHSGDSAVIDFQGKIIKECEAYKEEIISCSLNYNQLQQFRTGFNAGLDWDDFEIKI